MRTSTNYCCVVFVGWYILASVLGLPENVLFNGTSQDPELTMSVKQIISYHGYPIESYDVKTEDGYVLEMQRIPYGKNVKVPKTLGKPVILQHGLLCSSAVWVINTPDKNLAYLLADEGFDVWLTNIRGNEFGNKHVNITTENKDFWKFSWDEMALYDLPAIIDGIINRTEHNQVFYIGHDMGATIAFAMLAAKPEYNKKIKVLMALAPTVYLDSTEEGPIKELAANAHNKEFIAEMKKNEEFLTNTDILRTFSNTACRSPLEKLCASVFFLFHGLDVTQLNKTRIPLYLHFTPAGTSLDTVLHFAQEIVSKKFQRYDYGPELNLLKYGQKNPPEYPLSDVKVPVAVLSSDSDTLATTKDVRHLTDQLTNLIVNYCVTKAAQFSHLDFVWGNNANLQIYNKLPAIMKSQWKD